MVAFWDRKIIRIATRISLAVCALSLLIIILHEGPLEDRLRCKGLEVDGNAWLFIGSRWSAQGRAGGLAIPLHLLAPICDVLPILEGVHRFRLQRRRDLGRCLSCGYDLRASLQRCPECGAPVTQHQR